jgi:CDP-glucose 4,6-dehydratase
MHCEHLEPDIRNEAHGEIPNQCVSSAKARRVLGWSARYARDEAMLETIAWYRAYFGLTPSKDGDCG